MYRRDRIVPANRVSAVVAVMHSEPLLRTKGLPSTLMLWRLRVPVRQHNLKRLEATVCHKGWLCLISFQACTKSRGRPHTAALRCPAEPSRHRGAHRSSLTVVHSAFLSFGGLGLGVWPAAFQVAGPLAGEVQGFV